jgi:hypothetical protein
MRDILENSSTTSFAGLENHSNFMGPNVFATELHKYLAQLKKDKANAHFTLPKFYFSVSGAVTAQSNIRVGQSFATIVQTIANTENTKDILLPRWALFEIRSNYKKKVEELLSVPGNFVWTSPPAKRDVVARHDDGTTAEMFLADDSHLNVSSFLGILRKILEKNKVTTVLISLNGANQKDPLGINPLEKEFSSAGEEIAYVI